jgi:DNA-directed RNA polymerase subunit F
VARKILEEKIITNSEAKGVLEKVKEEELGEFQRRTLDFTRRFTKIPSDRASRLVDELSSKLQLDRNDAVQIVNTLPQSVEELRAVLTVKGRFVSTEQLNGILEIMKRYV